MRKIHRMLSVVSAAVVMCAVVLSTMVPALAARGDTANPAYVAISAIRCSMTLSSGKLNCDAYTRVQSGCTAEVTAVLWRDNGSGWEECKTWSAKKTNSAEIYESYAPESGYRYKLEATHAAYDSSGKKLESDTKQSGIIDLR